MINTTFIRQVGISQWATRYFKRQFTKRVMKRDNRMRLPTGSMIILPRQSRSATEVYVTKANADWGSEALFAKFADRNRDFIDVGAHIGYYSLYLSPLVRKVYAFEPDPRNLPGLRDNAALVKNIEIVEMAVSSRNGDGRLDVSGDSGVSTLNVSGGETINVRMTRIDDFIAGYPKLDPAMIKTDVEGHDFEALRGMKETVARHQPLILVECNANGLVGLCAEWRYSMFAFTLDKATVRTTFRQLSSLDDLQNNLTKMVFLVPHRLVTAFIEQLP
jgi:FkbM family methyltransferase